MPLDDLLALLEGQAEESTERELARARAEADERLAGVRARLDGELRDALAEHREKRSFEDERLLTVAHRAASSRVYQARQRLLNRVFAAAEQRLAAWGSDSAPPEEALRGLEEALASLRSSEAVLYAPERWRATIAERLAGHVELLEPDRSPDLTGARAPGRAPELALATPDRRRTIDLSPGSRLERSRAEISIVLLRELGVPKWSPTAEI